MHPDTAVPGRDGQRSARRCRSVWWVIAAGALLIGCGDDGGAAPASEGVAPRFVDDSAGSGIDHSYEGEFEFFVGGGVAAFDCDDDGREDLFFAGGSEPAALYRNESEVGGELRFARLPSLVTDLESVTGAYPIDIDSDEHVDLAVLRHGDDVLLRGLGGCTFAEADEQFELGDVGDWTVGFSATWEGANTLPTMAFGNYIVPESADETCDVSTLVRPAQGGDRYAAPEPLAPGYCALSMLFSDWGRSGERDLRVANDKNYYVGGQEQLWRIRRGEAPREYTEADGWLPLKIFGMGIASRDITGDGLPEVFLTSQGDNKLQTLADGAQQPTYKDMALQAGVTAQRPYTGDDVLPSTAWHPEFADVNNDGLADLFLSKGNVEGQTDHAMRDPSNLFIGQPDGTFVEGGETAGIVGFDRSRGAALVDLNLDGMLDLIVVNREAAVSVWRNVGGGDAAAAAPMGNWVAIRVHQAAPNVDAIGAWVDVRVGDTVTSRELTIGGGHAGGQLGWVHFGLGTADGAEVRVHWPDGEVGSWMQVDGGTFVVIDRDAAAPTVWSPDGAAVSG